MNRIKQRILGIPFVTITMIPFFMQLAFAVEETTAASGGIMDTIKEKGFIGFLIAGGWIFIVTGIGHVITIVAPILGVKAVADKTKGKKSKKGKVESNINESEITKPEQTDTAENETTENETAENEITEVISQ